jgi:hypothetical protein
MRRVLVVGVSLAFVVSASPHRVCADPTTPQISPIHLQREDAQRLRDQQRGLDGEPPVVTPAPRVPGAPAAPAPGTPAPVVVDPTAAGAPRKPPPVPEVHSGRGQRTAGIVLVGVAGLSALISVPLLIAGSGPDEGDADIKNLHDGWTTTGEVFLVTALATGVIGISLIATSKSSVQLVPVATSSSAGVAIRVRM